MRRAIWVLAATVLLGPAAMGAETNLAGGALVTHYVPEVPYSTEPPACGDWCCGYDDYAISDPLHENIRIDGPAGAIWYVLAAWSEPKVWCGTEFGFGNYDPGVCTIDESGYCVPVSGLEISTEGWPGPNQGTAITTTGTDYWTGNWVPVYYFVSYVYAVAGQIPIAADPTTSFVGFSNCENPTQSYPVDENSEAWYYRGAMGFNTDGIRAAPSVVPQAVCCVGTSCLIQTEAACDDLGGEWHPEWPESCDPNPCDPVHPCCFGTTTLSCGLLTQSLCASRPGPGVWHPEWDSCDPDPCKVAACCVGETCTELTELECVNASGIWLETVEGCDPNPCLTYVCCIPSQPCQNLTEDDCLAITGATWHEGYKCNDPGVECDALGACCLDADPYCVLTWEQGCLDLHPEVTPPFTPGQVWHPGGDCQVGNPWCHPSPVEETTWGRIKQLYQ